MAQRQGFAPLSARPGEQPTRLFSLRQADMSTSYPCAYRLRPHRAPPSFPSRLPVEVKGADKSQLPFPWRRDRDLNPGRHHCLTRFRIVRVQPLRHLCKGGGHTDAEAVRPEYIQTDANSILQEIGKKSNRFCALAGDFLVEGRISLQPSLGKIKKLTYAKKSFALLF